MTVRFDPAQSVEQVAAALRDAAAAAWGDDALPEVASALDVAAQSIWRISQEPLEPSDVEP